MPWPGVSPSAAHSRGAVLVKGKKAKEVAIAVVLVNIQAICRRFRISGYFPSPNFVVEDASDKLRPPVPYPEPAGECSNQSTAIIGGSAGANNLSGGSRTTLVIH